MQAFSSRLTNLHETLTMILDRYQRVCERAYGPYPTADSAGTEPVPSGILNMLGAQLGGIEQTAKALYAICDRIDAIV